MKKTLSILAVLVVVSLFSFSTAMANSEQEPIDDGAVINLSTHSTMVFDRDTSDNNPDYQ